MNKRALIYSALIGGAVMAILGNIPFVNILNCIACIWVWAGGILAVYLYRRFNAADPVLSGKQAALLGLVAGAIGGVISVMLGMLFKSVMPAAVLAMFKDNPDVYEMMKSATSSGFSVIGTLIDLVLYSGFGALSAFVAVKAFWKTPKPASSAEPVQPGAPFVEVPGAEKPELDDKGQ